MPASDPPQKIFGILNAMAVALAATNTAGLAGCAAVAIYYMVQACRQTPVRDVPIRNVSWVAKIVPRSGLTGPQRPPGLPELLGPQGLPGATGRRGSPGAGSSNTADSTDPIDTGCPDLDQDQLLDTISNLSEARQQRFFQWAIKKIDMSGGIDAILDADWQNSGRHGVTSEFGVISEIDDEIGGSGLHDTISRDTI